MMARFLLLYDRLFSDDHVRRWEPEFSIALRQALLLIGPFAVILGIGLMAILP